MNTTLKVLCTHCGKLIPEAESDAHCATHEMTPIPAVARAERERLIADLANVWMNTQAAPGQVIRNAAKMLRADADLIQRAQADALDARLLMQRAVHWIRSHEDCNSGYAIVEAIDAALRTSSPDPVGGET